MTVDYDGPLWRCPNCDHVQPFDASETIHPTCAACGFVPAPVPENPDTGDDDLPMTVTQARSVASHLAGVGRDLEAITRDAVHWRGRAAILQEENRKLRRAIAAMTNGDAILEVLEGLEAEQRAAATSAGALRVLLIGNENDDEGRRDGDA